MEFILTHMDNMADFMYAVMQFITFVTVTTCYVCFSLRKVETLHFFEKLQSIVNAYRKFFFRIRHVDGNKNIDAIKNPLNLKEYVKIAIDSMVMQRNGLME